MPLLAAAHLRARVARLGPALADLTGLPASVAGVEAGLSGTVRVTGVRVGDVVAVDAIEASVSLASLLAGDLGADEVRLERPRLRAQVDADGDSNLARILRRVAARRALAVRGGGATGGRRLRRVVVTEGALVLDLVGVGVVEARGVELHPQRDGVRLVTGPVRARLERGPLALDARLERAGGDLTLPDLRVGRMLAVGGAVSIAAGGPALDVRGATVAWRVDGARALALRGDADDHGVPRPLLAQLQPAVTPGDGQTVQVEGASIPLGWLAPLAPRGLELDAGRASGALRLAATSHDAHDWTVELDGALAGVRIDHPAVSDSSFAFDGEVSAEVSASGDVLSVTSLRLRRGALTIDARGQVRRGGPAGLAAGELHAALAAAPCLGLVDALPPEIIGPLAGLAVEGELGATLRLRFDLDAAAGDGVELGLDVDNRCRVLADPPEADARALAGIVDHSFPDGTRAPVGPGVGDWAAMIALPGHVDGAFVAAEDARFWDHPGFDLTQIARSLEINLREGRFARGGSTISQQLVKNALLSHRRTLDRKLQEAVLTWRLEATLSKRQILERYLNIVELGPGIYGIAAAARHWFGKPARELSVAEAAFLAALTPEPRTMSRRIATAGGLDPDSAARVETVLRHMQRAGVISVAARDEARRARLAFRPDALAVRVSAR